MPLDPPIPANSPLRTHLKRGLPASLASTYPHGHISGHPRSAAAQRAFEARKAQILRTMSAEQIESAYQENVRKILGMLEADRRRNEEIDREMEKAEAQRELERRLFWRQKNEKKEKEKEKEKEAGKEKESGKEKDALAADGKGDAVEKDNEIELDKAKETESEKEKEKEVKKEADS